MADEVNKTYFVFDDGLLVGNIHGDFKGTRKPLERYEFCAICQLLSPPQTEMRP